jgi:TolB-like protein/Tfp pilus assembly protein PilF
MTDKSIAVLPFANMSDGDENEFFSDGLAEELLNRLSRVPDLRVAARTSSFHFKGHTGDVSAVAQQLNVKTVLEGSVRRAGDRVRVTAQLINASDGFHLWSESYDGQLDDIFGIQETIATQVVEALKITLLGEDARRLAAHPTDSVEGYEAYLLGHQRMRTRRTDELEQAVEYFQRAIALDSEFALAYVGQAEAVAHLSEYGTLSPRESLERSMPLLERAMELDDRLGEVYAVRSLLRRRQGDADGAFADLERAIELNPNYANAYVWRASYEDDPERQLKLLQQALELDPLSPLVHTNSAVYLRELGRYEEALKSLQRVVEIDPEYTAAYVNIATLHEDIFHQPDEAIRWQERATAADPGNPGLRDGLVGRLRNFGRLDDAANLIRETIAANPEFLDAYESMAEIHEAHGRVDEAIRWNHEWHQRDPSDPEPLMEMAGLYSLLGDEPSVELWLTRLRETEGGELPSRIVQAVLHVQRDELAKAETIFREVVTANSGWYPLIFDFDLEAGNYDAILEREAESEPLLFESPPKVHGRNVESALRVGAALAGRGDQRRADQMLGKCEEFLLGLDEAHRRARFPDLLAAVYLLQGRNDEALTEWRIAYESGWTGTPINEGFEWWFLEAPFSRFDPVRDDPRFRVLIADIRAELDRQRRALERDGLAITD